MENLCEEELVKLYYLLQHYLYKIVFLQVKLVNCILIDSEQVYTMRAMRAGKSSIHFQFVCIVMSQVVNV